MARTRNRGPGMVEKCKELASQYRCVATYLAYIAAPYAAAAIDMPGLAQYVPSKSAGVALFADAAEGIGLFPTAAKFVLGAVGVYNGIGAFVDASNGEFGKAAFEGWLSYVTLRDAFVRHETVERR